MAYPKFILDVEEKYLNHTEYPMFTAEIVNRNNPADVILSSFKYYTEIDFEGNGNDANNAIIDAVQYLRFTLKGKP
jgi:hypothetical protein